jgi:hypothetical protein
MHRAKPTGRSPRKVARSFRPSRLQQQHLLMAYEILLPMRAPPTRCGARGERPSASRPQTMAERPAVGA